MKRLSADGLLLTHSNTESSIKGLILLDEGPMLIVSRPILTSMGGRPIRGTLIMGRYIDLEMLNPSPRVMRLTLQRLDGAHMSPDFQRALSSFPQNGPIVVQKLNESTIAGYSLLRDVYGKPALVLRVEMPRDVYAQGKKSAFYLILALVVAFVSEKRVEMEKRGDLTARMSLSGNDELSQLADAINGMLAALENSQNELIDSEKRYRTLFNSTSDAVFVHGLTEDGMPGRFIEVNNVACETLGYTREELLRFSPKDITKSEYRKDIPSAMEKLLADEHVSFESVLVTKDGREIPVEITVNLFELDGKGMVLSTARNISERKMMEEMKRRAYEQIDRNTEQFATLVDHIRNPLSVIVGLAELRDDETARRILAQTERIEHILKQLDEGWVQSEKVREFLRKNL